MAARFTNAFRTTRANTIVTLASSGALIRIYSGSQPATADTAASGTLLAELTCSSTLGTVSNGVLTFNAITQDSSANATGTAGWFRIVNSAGTTTVMDGSVTASGGGGDLQLVSTSITSGQPVQITSFTITEPGA